MGCLVAIFASIVALVFAMAFIVFLAGAWPVEVLPATILALVVGFAWSEWRSFRRPMPQRWVRTLESRLVVLPAPGRVVAVVPDAEWRAHASDCPVCMAAFWLDKEPCQAGRELCA
jgi:membrane protein implicated in regulation of membrane protease activity